MRTLYRPFHPDRRADALVILLPGALQQPEGLVEAGFPEVVHTRGLLLDMALVDLQLKFVGDAIDRAALQRLHEDVVRPAQQQGYGQIWMAGISIGGFMSLAYASEYRGHLAGLCLLAPYPGSRIVTNEIQAAGGIGQWDAGKTDDDAERRVWQWLQSRRAAEPAEIFIGYGLQDRFAVGQRLMAAAMPEACVATIDGTHDWPAWLQLWGKFIAYMAARVQHRNAGDLA